MTHLLLHQNTKLGVFGTGCRPDNEEKRRNKAWKAMRKSLNFDRSYIEQLIQNSQFIRHGQGTFRNSDQRTKDLEIAWTVVDRFIHFLENSEKQLPLERFVLLTETSTENAKVVLIIED